MRFSLNPRSILRTCLLSGIIGLAVSATITPRSVIHQDTTTTDSSVSIVENLGTSLANFFWGANTPIIFFVPGAWHHYDFFAKTRLGLLYPSDTINHPSIGAYPPIKDMNDDIAALRAALLTHINAGKQVVLLCHSYGGIVGSSAVRQLSYKHRKALGLKGGIISIMYVSAFIVPSGSSVRDMLPGGEWNPWMKFQGDLSFTEDETNIFYHDLSAVEQTYWISRLRHHSKRAYEVKVGPNGEGWKEVPSMYVFCEDDRALPRVVQGIWKDSMGPGVATFSINSSHSPFISKPGKVREAIAAAVTFGKQQSGAP
ncbi:hypothetical protein EX30DRAFT_330744 [Ascodesmis nigricans]|uniref:AB hydrolase-1 domain-containing protein n=1 Tax=Ascodesmis nigricans TaxID=341454 RepID=A0A4S2MY61_9PEZI|nr:hypothetical protein EX30DRAFT_330744 [Ascodesmis nigricans]